MDETAAQKVSRRLRGLGQGPRQGGHSPIGLQRSQGGLGIIGCQQHQAQAAMCTTVQHHLECPERLRGFPVTAGERLGLAEPEAAVGA